MQLRECPFCKEDIRRDVSVCPRCQRESPAWVWESGYWWFREESGAWLQLHEETGEWERYDDVASDRPAAAAVKGRSVYGRAWLVCGLAATLALAVVSGVGGCDDGTVDGSLTLWFVFGFAAAGFFSVWAGTEIERSYPQSKYRGFFGCIGFVVVFFVSAFMLAILAYLMATIRCS